MNSTLLILIALLFISKIVVGAGEKIKIPASLTELVVGIAFGFAARQLDWPIEEWLHSDIFHGFTEFGVLLLLFAIGFETDINEMKKVGVESFLAALYGVVAPFILAIFLLPIFFEKTFEHDLFIAAALTATSVGITARVFKDLGILNSISGRIVLGAAVIDDVMGIMVLTFVTSYISKGAPGASFFLIWALKTFLFGFLIWFLSKRFIPPFLNWLRKVQTDGTLVGFLVAVLMLASYMAENLGLSAVIGAFAIGVALDNSHFEDSEKLLKPLTDFFVPMFFIGMGMQVDIRAILSSDIMLYAIALLGCAIVGKCVCGLALKRSSVKNGASRWLVGFGMLPRGEVGLIFAAMGKKIEIFDDQDFAAIVFMVVATTMLAPFLIQWISSSSKRIKSTDA